MSAARLKEQLKQYEEDLEAAKARGSSSVEHYEDQVKKLKKELDKELEKPQPHPALQFGPRAQTVAIMCAISLMMSASPLPREMIPFYRLFSLITTVALICLVVYTSIVYYGYQEALAKLPKPKTDQEKRYEKLMKTKKDRPDLWAHTRSHPSAFLTTKAAQPRLFPFPLGKSRPDASIKDELWWEGGNAPHVGHFNRPELPAPPPPDESVLLARVQASMKRETQEKLWKKRIRTIQILCVIIIISFANRKVAIAALCFLIYNTVSTELEDMLKPPDSMDEVYDVIDKLQRFKGIESAPKPSQIVGGMSYIHLPDPIGGDGRDNQALQHNSNIPIDFVPPPVLMTTTNHWYAGPGNEMKAEK